MTCHNVNIQTKDIAIFVITEIPAPSESVNDITDIHVNNGLEN